MATNYNGQLKSNEIFSSIYNLIIAQQVFADNIAGTKSELVDATAVGKNHKQIENVVLGIHEGKDGFYNRKVHHQTRENRSWNYAVMHNTTTHYGYLSEKGNRVLHLDNGMCCTIDTYMK